MQQNDKTEKLKEAKEDLGKYQAIEAVANTDGGKVLLKATVEDINTAIDSLVQNYMTATDSEIRAYCAQLAVNYNLFKTLTNAPKNKQFAIEELKAFGEEVD